MDYFYWVLMNIVGPIVLLGLLLWLAFSWRRRSPRDDSESDRATHELYEEEERRRRMGTDDE